MGCKVLCPSVALLAYLMICQHVRAQCTQPSFASNNVMPTEYPSSFPDGSTVTFQCIVGHRPVDSQASKSVTCQGTQWTRLELNCTRKSCGSLADIVHGRYIMTGNLFGDTAKPVCDLGYVLAGRETTRTCRDGEWDGRDALCEAVTCSAPPGIENGQLEDVPLESYEYSVAVTYKCNAGLNLIGKSTLHCSEDGTFKPDPPKCFDGCPTPRIPNARRINGKSPPYKLSNFVDYKCEDGHTMKGEAHIVCTENGWDPEEPRCIAPCSPPVLSDQLTLTQDFRSSKIFPHGFTVTVECIHGYKPNGTMMYQKITCEETNWAKVNLTCIAPCSPPVLSDQLTLTRDFLSSKIFPHGSTVTVECIYGYKPNGTMMYQEIICEETNWAKVNLTCIALPTSPPTSPPTTKTTTTVATSTARTTAKVLPEEKALPTSPPTTKATTTVATSTTHTTAKVLPKEKEDTTSKLTFETPNYAWLWVLVPIGVIVGVAVYLYKKRSKHQYSDKVATNNQEDCL